jgi:hypothetical protein
MSFPFDPIPTTHDVLSDDDLGVRTRVAEKLSNDDILRVMTLWVEKLESGQYPQDQVHLKSYDGYCCLGVLIEAVLELGLLDEPWDAPYPDDGSGSYEFMGHSGLIPDRLVDMLGIGDDGSKVRGRGRWYSPLSNVWFTAMSEANDHLGLSFPAIASAIRYEYGIERAKEETS